MLEYKKRQLLWSQLRMFLAAWYRPLAADDGIPPAEIESVERDYRLSLPRALREWYLMAGRRQDVTNNQNYFAVPSQLSVAGNFLVFYRENQDLAAWGIRLVDLSLPDPPVFLNPDYSLKAVDPAAWIKENSTLAEFIFQVIFYEAMMGAKGERASVEIQLPDTALDELERKFDRLNLPTWQWPVDDTRLYGSSSTILFYDYAFLYVVAKTQDVFLAVEAVIGVPLERGGQIAY